jgi:hypothetical protein
MPCVRLRRYCECFAAKVFCSGCQCEQCLNTPDNLDLILEARKQIEVRNPEAFQSKILTPVAVVSPLSLSLPLTISGQPVPTGHPSEGQLRSSKTPVRLGQDAAVSEYQ